MSDGAIIAIPKVERLNAAYSLLAQGVTANEAVLRLSQRFGLSQRQAYR